MGVTKAPHGLDCLSLLEKSVKEHFFKSTPFYLSAVADTSLNVTGDKLFDVNTSRFG